MMRSTLGIPVVILALAWCPAALAQPAPDTAVAAALAAFRPGDRIRVALLSERWTGRYERVGGDTLFFGSPGQPPMAIRFNAIDTVWRRSNAATRGAWIGGISGGLLGAFAGVVISTLGGAEGASYSDSGDAGAALVGAIVGIVVGSETGRLIGRAFRGWRRIHP